MRGKWLLADVNPTKANLYYYEHKFNAEKGATMTANVCADARYKLYLNDQYVCDGPCRGSNHVRYYEQPELTPYLKEGENKIRVEVLFVTEDMFISIFRYSKPALWFDGYLTEGDKVTQVCSDLDGTWTCRRLDSVEFVNPHGWMPSLPPYQKVYGEDSFTDISLITTNDSIERECVGPCGIVDRYPLEPRMIPLFKPEERKPFKLIKNEQGLKTVDAGAYTTAEVCFRFKGTKGEKLHIKYSECFQRHGSGKKGLRDDSTGWLGGAIDEITLTGEWQTFETFFFKAFRFVQLEFNAETELEVDWDRSGYMVYFYPLNENGTFECNDERLNRIWDISKNTVKCCMHEIFVDCPHYEQQQYGMDTALEVMFQMRMSDDSRIIKKSIIDFVHSQLPNGMLQANYPSRDVQVIPTFSLYWILMVREYLRYRGDEEFVRTLTGTIDKVLEAFNTILTKEGLVGVTKYWHFVDWVPGWPLGRPACGDCEPLTVYSLIYAAALNASAEICDAVGRTALASEYRMRHQDMVANINTHCYNTEAGLYRDTPCVDNFSRHTALWAVLSGAKTGNEATELMERAMNADIAVPTFSMNYYMFRALEESGCYKYADKVMDGWQHMLDLNCTTWCENPDDPRSECHGWSSAPIYEFSAMRLGVQPTENGFRAVKIKPVTDGLEWAMGMVPTPYGLIKVEWKKENGKLIFNAEMPKDANVPVTVEIEGAEAFTTTENTIYMEV